MCIVSYYMSPNIHMWSFVIVTVLLTFAMEELTFGVEDRENGYIRVFVPLGEEVT